MDENSFFNMRSRDKNHGNIKLFILTKLLEVQSPQNFQHFGPTETLFSKEEFQVLFLV